MLFFDLFVFSLTLFFGKHILLGQLELYLMMGYLFEEGIHCIYNIVHLDRDVVTNTFVALAGGLISTILQIQD